jgi:hypothetical protein
LRSGLIGVAVMKQNLGCFNLTGLLAAIVVVILAGAAGLLTGGSLFSSGGLNSIAGPVLGEVTSHAGLGGNCSACHTSPFSPETMNDRCLLCHQDVAAQFKNPTSLHGSTMIKDPSQPCRVCHTEHHGPSASLTKAQLAAGMHDQFGFSLKAHAKLQNGNPFSCKDCHTSGYASFDQTICSTCHMQIDNSRMQSHIAAYGTSCNACHDGIDSYGKSFDHHTATFKLTGKHGSLDCYACHNGDVKLADMKSTPMQCVDCHQKDDIHLGGLGKDCGSCHVTDSWVQATIDHSKTSFALTGAHINVACTDCHINNVFKGTPTTCYACHQSKDIHNGDFGQDCGACHKTDAWSDVTFDHSKSIFPLTGAHINVACTSCHVNNVFKGTPATCYACHKSKDIHNGSFGQDCAACHKTDAWSDITFDHAKSGFPLTGAHLSLACTRCHINNVFKGTPVQCISCHADPAFHAGLFGTNCSSCHTTTAWLPASFNGPHQFPTNHGGANTCRSCHPNSLASYTCFSCHNQGQMVSRHAAQGITDISNCVRCHASGGGGDSGGGGG